MAKLRRTRDGEGFAGSIVFAIRLDPTNPKKLETKETKKPIIGWALRVGSVTAGTYSTRDWWMTTPVTEILEEKTNNQYYCKFKTGNSTYEFWN